MSSRSISKGIVSVGAWSIARIVVSGLVLPIFSRLLGVEGYGQYAYYQALLLLCAHPANCGMAQALTKYIAERPDDRRWRNGLAALAARVNGVAALAVGLGVLCMVGAAARFDTGWLLMAGIMVGLLWCEQLQQYAHGILFGLHREAEFTGPSSVGVVISALCGVTLVALGYGVRGALGGWLIAAALVAFVVVRFALRAIRTGETRADSVPVPQRDVLRFGLSSMVYASLAMALYSIDVVLVRHFAGDEQTALYAAAVQWSQFVWFVPVAIEWVMMQSTSRLWAEGRVGEITQLVGRLIRYVALLTAFVLLLVFVMAEPIVTIYFGGQFREAAVVLQCLIPGVLVFSVARVVRSVIHSGGWVVPLVKIVLVGLVANVLLISSFVPRWGAIGAAIAASSSFIGVTACFLYLLHQKGVRIFTDWSVARLCWLCLTTGAMLCLIRLVLQSPLAALVVGSMTAAALYWSGVFWLKLVRVNELASLVESLPGPVRAVGTRLLSMVKPVLIRIEAMAWN